MKILLTLLATLLTVTALTSSKPNAASRAKTTNTLTINDQRPPPAPTFMR